MDVPTLNENLERSPENAGRVFNVASNSSDPVEKRLSNLDHAPFVLDGREYASVEGLWQGLKYSEGSDERERIAGLSGIESKKAGNGAPQSGTFVYLGETYSVGSPEHQALMKRAIRAKLEQNPEVRELLLSTGNAPIIHDPKRRDGTSYPDSTTVPAVVFSRFLAELREEFQHKSMEKSQFTTVYERVRNPLETAGILSAVEE